MMRTFHPPPNTIRVKGIREESKTKVYNAVRKVTRIKEIEDITSREIKTGERLLYLLQTIFLEVTSRLKCVLYYPDKWIQFRICFFFSNHPIYEINSLYPFSLFFHQRIFCSFPLFLAFFFSPYFLKSFSNPNHVSLILNISYIVYAPYFFNLTT